MTLYLQVNIAKRNQMYYQTDTDPNKIISTVDQLIFDPNFQILT